MLAALERAKRIGDQADVRELLEAERLADERQARAETLAKLAEVQDHASIARNGHTQSELARLMREQAEARADRREHALAELAAVAPELAQAIPALSPEPSDDELLARHHQGRDQFVLIRSRLIKRFDRSPSRGLTRARRARRGYDFRGARQYPEGDNPLMRISPEFGDF